MTSSDQRYVNEGALNPAPESSWGKLLPRIPEGSLVLEVGCAHGSFSYAMKTHRKCRVIGVEIDPQWAEQAKTHCEEVLVGDITQLLDGPLKGRTFDVIVAADVIEHLSNPGEVLRKLSVLLHKGGLLLASIPNVTHFSVLAELAQGRFPRSPEGLLDATHVQFFGEGDVLSLFKSADFAAAIVDRVRIDPPFTEFKTDLSRLTQPLIDFLDQSPNSNTYQFIVRAVPSQWATAADAQTVAPTSRAPVRESLAAAVQRAELTVAQLHERLGKQNDEASKLHEELSKYHQALTTRETQAAELKGLKEKAEKLRQVLETEQANRFEVQAPLSQLRVLYVAGRENASFRYRVYNACQQLRDAGIVANVAQLAAPDLLEEIPKYSLLVLFRVDWTAQVQEIVKRARESGAAVAFDIDDLIFHPASEELIPFLPKLSAHEIRTYREQFPALRRTLEEADFTIASTPTIGRYVEDLGKPAIVHPNLLSQMHLQLARVIYPTRAVLQRKPFIGYMSGSNTHDGDLALVTDALVHVLQQRPKVSLMLCGPVELPQALVPFKDRVARLPLEDYHTYPWLMARCRALIAPIEVLNDFADAKSALKVFEAGVLGVPVVASPTAPYRKAIRHGETGFLANNFEEWTEALLTLVDTRTSLAFGKRAREVALNEYSPDAFRFVLARALALRAGKFQGEAPALRPLTLDPLAAARPLSTLRKAQRIVRRSASLAIKRPALVGAPPPAPDVSRSADADVLDEGNAFSQLLAYAEREGDALLSCGKRVGTILVDLQRPLSAARAHDVVAHEQSIGPGASFTATGTDPSFLLHQSPGPSPRFLVLEMRVQPVPQTPWAQLFWKSEDQAPFSEANSVRFSIRGDGTLKTYVVDLNEALGKNGSFKDAQFLRFDPVDTFCDFEVIRLAFLSRKPVGKQPQVRAAIAQRFLKGQGLEIGALQNPMPPPAGATVRYVDRLTQEQARIEYPELNALKLVNPSVIAEADDLKPVADDSEDFVICNHVLEHIRDPIGALHEWLRVIKPSGNLYVAVPDQQNKLDIHRGVTPFEHLLADHRDEHREAEHRAHYDEWTWSVHKHHFDEDQQKAFTEKLVKDNYAIHFHVFDRASYWRLLQHVCAEAGAEVAEFLSTGEGSEREHIAVLRKVARQKLPAVDIVVPIYNAPEFTQKCVESVLAHARGDWRLILVHDASSLPEMKPLMKKLAALDERIVLLENDTNQGFVITANRGMRYAEGRDVLLLNSDTEVFEGFLERLQECAYADDTTGILTPFSNNATLCSIPEIGKDNPIPDGYTPQSWAALVSACSHKARPEIVTGVGFCMYVKAEVLAKIGYFDEVSYGRGFGEENDLCERAKKAGYQIRLCDDVFVYHKGKASFGDEGRALESTNGKILESRHPGYHADVARFFSNNPLTPLHADIHFHMKRSRRGAENALLFIVHASPWLPTAGGTEYHVKDLVRALKLPRVVVAFPQHSQLVAAEILDGDVDRPTLFRFPLRTPTSIFCLSHDEMESLLKHWITLFGISGVHIHHALFWPPGIGKVLKDAGVPYAYTSHDFYCVNPSWNLFDIEKRQRCDCKVEDSACVGPWLTWLNIPLPRSTVEFRQQHRAAFHTLVSGAKAVVFPSETAKTTVLGHFPDAAAKAQVIEHGYDGKVSAERPPAGSKLRVAAVGEISHPIKGARNYLELVSAIAGPDIEWHFFGGTQAFGFDEKLKALPNSGAFTFHGSYPREAISSLLAAQGIDLCVILPEVDETFSFVLSEAAIAGIPSLVLERGSLPNRVRRDGLGCVVKTVTEAVTQLQAFAENRNSLDAITERTRQFRHPTVKDNAEAYRKLYHDLGLFRVPPENPTFDPAQLQELAAVREQPTVLAAPVLGTSEEAAPAYQKSVWYPAFQRVKPLIPLQVRELGRKVLSRSQRKVFKIKPGRNEMRGLEVRQRRLTTILFESTSSDPQIVFSARSLDPTRVRAVRFRLRHQSPGRPNAQIFWTHSDQESFKEAKSASVQLQSPAGSWGDYVVTLDSPSVRPIWTGDGQLSLLRFDPLDAPGNFEVSDLEFFA